MAATCCLLASCSANSDRKLPDPGPATPGSPSPADAATGLPDLQSLEESARAGSIAGPGWQPLDLSAPVTAGMSSNAAAAGGAVEFDSTSGAAWRVFGLGDFRGDFRPSSLATDVVEDDVPYFLGHADYVSGRWELSGPFLGDAVLEYGSVDSHSDPSALVSPLGLHYVAFIVPEAGLLQLDGLSVGILGSDEPPLPVIEYQQNGGPDTIHFQWLDSPSSLDADFDGYIVQRSPFLALDWEDLHAQTRRGRTYSDDTVLPGTLYRYRVNTYDLAGNVAFGLPVVLQTTGPGNSPPVAIVDVPRGPHFGPVELRFDMSASFDPDGDPITGYAFDFGPGPAVVSQPGPVLDITLQPGNYIIECGVTATGGSTSDFVSLVVYPRWEDSSRLVEAGTEDIRRQYFPWTVTEADGSATTTFFFDALIPGIRAVSVDAGGVASNSYHSGFVNDFQILTEPVPYGDGWAFAAIASDYAIIYAWDGEEITALTDFNLRIDGGSCQLVTDGASGLYFIYWREDGPGDWALVWRDLVTSLNSNLLTSQPAPIDFDCDWNEQAAAFDAVYVSGGLQWIRFLPGALIASAAISADTPVSLEVDIDPATGRPAVVYFFADKVRYSALNPDLLTWSAPAPVELAANHGVNPQLLHADGNAYVAISIPSSGKVQVLENDGGGWVPWNVHDDDDLTDFISLAKLPGEDGLRIVSEHNDGSTRIFSIRDDDSQELLTKLAGVWGAGIELTAASSQDTIHLMQRQPGGVLHLASTDAKLWSSEAVPGTTPDEFVLGGSHTGVVQLSWTDGTDLYLDKWDGSAFVNLATGSIPTGRRPILSDEGPYRNAWEDLGGADFQIHQQFSGTIAHAMAGMPIWDGSLLGSNVVSRTLVFYGGSELEDANLGFADIVTNKVEHIADISGGIMSLSLLEGRGIRGATYRGLQTLADENVWHVCTGPDYRPLRVIRSHDESFSVEELPGFSGIEFGIPDVRRSSSARQAWGGTFVGLTAANLMSEYHFEWSRFGEFEELPLPVVPGMSLPELLVGPDGRWHIIFRDYINDDLRILSTLE